MAGLTQDSGHRYSFEHCPCESSQYNNYNVPPFVGNDYFCESGWQTAWSNGYSRTFFPNNTLWDGQNCISSSTCCQFNSPPWFAKILNVSTTDDIELRLCTIARPSISDVALELVELYVK